MVALMAIGMVVTVVAASIAIAVFLRSYVLNEVKLEQHLHDPHTSTVAFAIPAGADPAVFKTGLMHAGFANTVDRVGAAQCLLVECTPGQREAVRGVLQAAHTRAFDGSDLAVQRVVFEDER
jgi:hypothetical protein